MSILCTTTNLQCRIQILVPFERYGRPKKCTQKSYCNTSSIYIYHAKTKWNIVYEYLKTKIFSRDTNILPQMNWTSNIFGQSAKNIGGFWISLNYPTLNFKKTVCPKNVWMRHWLVISITYFRKLTIPLFRFGNMNSILEVGRRLFNPSRPVPRQRGEINSTFYFLTSL